MASSTRKRNMSKTAGGELVKEEDDDKGEDGEKDEHGEEEEDNVEPLSKRLKSGGGGSRLGPVPVTLTDVEVLDCSICYCPLHSPVYECENGHMACASCCSKLVKSKCPYCDSRLGARRCRAIERVLEAILVACKNECNGCSEKMSYGTKLAHEKMCDYTPCSCPNLACDFIGMRQSLNEHFWNKHPRAGRRINFSSLIDLSLRSGQKYVFLQEKTEKGIFVLTRCTKTEGSFINVVCISPDFKNLAFNYQLSAIHGENNATNVRLCARMECTPEWTGLLSDTMYLFVPKAFIGQGGLLKLTVFISKRNI